MIKMRLLILFCLCINSHHVFAEENAAKETLKENKILTELSPKPIIKRWEDTQPLHRNYTRQPPIIPHTTKGYVINLKFNKCLTCHSDENAKTTGAPPVGSSHYTDREGHLTQKIAGRRYFCVQCHVPQMETDPLIPNDFEEAK